MVDVAVLGAGLADTSKAYKMGRHHIKWICNTRLEKIEPDKVLVSKIALGQKGIPHVT